MKKNGKRILTLVFACLIMVGIVGACAKQEEVKDTQKQEAQSEKDREQNKDESKALKGSLTLAGSTSMEKLSNVVAEAFMNNHSGVMVTAEFIGSSAGVEQVIAKTVDIGNASRYLKESEKANGAVENVVAIDGIAIIVDSDNTINNLTKDQLVSIYKGDIKNWSEVGGSDAPIVVVGREAGSGTRGAFEEILKVEDSCAYTNEINSTGGVMAKVSSTQGAIGYVSLDVIDNTVIALKLEGIEPTEENIKAGQYFLSRPFVMATMGEISEQSELVQKFFEFMFSQEGQELVKKVGLISID